MNKILLLLVFSIVLQNCAPTKEQQTQRGLTYQVRQINLSKEITFRFKEVVCQQDSDRIKITLDLFNPTSDSIIMAITDWELGTEEGTHSSVINTSNPSIAIKSNTPAKFDLVFEPTNSLKLFRETGLKGALLRSYQLIYKGKSIIDFQASEIDYSSYKKNKKEPEVFFLSMNDDFKTSELTYLKTNLGLEKNDVEIHEQEILIDGVNLVLNVYSYNDTLYVKLKLVNHSLFPVRIKPGAMTVQLDNKNLTSTNKHKANEATIPRSQRGYVEERYHLHTSGTDQFLLNISSIDFMAQKPIPLFYCEQVSLKLSNSGL